MPLHKETVDRLLTTKSDKVADELAASLCHFTDDQIVDVLISCIEERCENGGKTDATKQRLVAIFSDVLPNHLRHHHRLQLFHHLADRLDKTDTSINLPDALPE